MPWRMQLRAEAGSFLAHSAHSASTRPCVPRAGLPWRACELCGQDYHSAPESCGAMLEEDTVNVRYSWCQLHG
jgi:hypothetical protein